ncbi:cell division protein ZapB [Thermodesulfobacteriota bacterium]
MEQKVEIDQFSVLEEKVGFLIKSVVSLREEKNVLEKKSQDLLKITTDLTSEIDQLKKSKEEARVKVESLLAKIGDLGI